MSNTLNFCTTEVDDFLNNTTLIFHTRCISFSIIITRISVDTNVASEVIELVSLLKVSTDKAK